MRCFCLLSVALVLSGCDGADAPVGAAETGDLSTTEGADSTSGGLPSGNTEVSASDSTSTTTSTTSSSTSGTPSTVTTDPTGDSGGSTGCPVSSVGCPCEDNTCSDGLVCEDGVCEPPSACDVDLLEPNDDESMPTLLGEINDNDDAGGSIFGTLDGPDDVDWYRYSGDDDFLYDVDPARFVKSTGGVRLCKFAECEGGVGDTDIECPAETEAATSPMGRPGCCAPAGVALGDANCTGVLEDNMQVFMRVDQAQDACTAYELIYHY